MRQILLCLLTLVVVVGPTYALRIAQLPGDVALPLAEGWEVVDSAVGFPYRLIHFDESAEMTIHQSIISEEEIIASQVDFKASVDSVISGVVMNLPDAHVVSSTGMQEDNWAAFAIEFESWDNDVLSDLRHRLSGVLYYHPDGHQLLFTLWARATMQTWPMLIDDILFMQAGFVYLGPTDANALGGDAQEVSWAYLIVPLLGIGFAQMLRARVRRNQTQPRRRRPIRRTQPTVAPSPDSN